MLADRALVQPRDQFRRDSGCGCAISTRSARTASVPDFDDNLRQAFRQETELFFDSVLREDRSVLDSDQGGLHVPQRAPREALRDSRRLRQPFRRVTLAPDSKRGGLLRQGSVLSVTSYATRTSPVIRGVWVLEQHLRRAAAAAAANVPALDESTVAANLPMRERLAAHRNNAVCASCHRTIDPVGFSLENFDAVGQWRDLRKGISPIDASGALPGGSGIRASPGSKTRC